MGLRYVVSKTMKGSHSSKCTQFIHVIHFDVLDKLYCVPYYLPLKEIQSYLRNYLQCVTLYFTKHSQYSHFILLFTVIILYFDF